MPMSPSNSLATQSLQLPEHVPSEHGAPHVRRLPSTSWPHSVRANGGVFGTSCIMQALPSVCAMSFDAPSVCASVGAGRGAHEIEAAPAMVATTSTVGMRSAFMNGKRTAFCQRPASRCTSRINVDRSPRSSPATGNLASCSALCTGAQREYCSALPTSSVGDTTSVIDTVLP